MTEIYNIQKVMKKAGFFHFKFFLQNSGKGIITVLKIASMRSRRNGEQVKKKFRVKERRIFKNIRNFKKCRFELQKTV